MALSILQSPASYTFARQPTVFLLKDAANVNKQGFSFVASLFDENGDLIVSMNIPKRPVNGFGLVDLSDYLSAYVNEEEDIVPGANEFLRAPNFARNYTIQFGEKSDLFTYFDYGFGPAGKTLLSSATDRHDFVVSDRVLVTQDPGYLYPSLDGEQVVISVPDEFSIVLDLSFPGVGPASPGSVRHINGESIVYTGITGFTGVTIAGAIPREEFTEYGSTRFVPSSSTASCDIMTLCPDGFRVKLDSQMFVPVPNLISTLTYMRITTKNAAGTTLGVYGWQIDSAIRFSDLPFVFAPCGPANLTDQNNTWSGPTSDIFAGVDHYYVGFMQNSSASDDPVISTREMRIDIDDRCDPFQESFTLLFCDALGAWSPFTFNSRSDEVHQTKKDVFLRSDFGRIQSEAYNYSNKRRGLEVYNAEHVRTYVVRSDWMTTEESEYFVQCFTAARAFWCKSATKFLPIILSDGKVERLKPEQEDDPTMIRYEISFALAYAEPPRV